MKHKHHWTDSREGVPPYCPECGEEAMPITAQAHAFGNRLTGRNSGYVPEGGVWTAADTRRYLSGFDPSVAAKLNSTVAALIRALEDSTIILRQSGGIAEDGQALQNTALLAEVKK